MIRSLFVFLVFGTLVGSGFFAFALKTDGATALQTVVEECKKRTGFGDETCKTLVKKYMNVDRCKEYTGFSTEECEKKIEEIKQDPEFQGRTREPGGGSITSSRQIPSGSTPVIPSQGKEGLLALRAKKERDLIMLWQHTEKMTKYLKEKGVDVLAIEGHFPEFEKKAEEVLARYDAYISVFEMSAKENASTREKLRFQARDSLRISINELMSFYRMNIFAPLRLAIEKLP